MMSDPLPNGERSRAAARRFARLAFVTAALTYALIVFGGIVRITGSGMGCGEDWPLCNGQLIPPMDFETLIEYGHRLAAALVSFFVIGVAAYAIRHRRTSSIAGRGVLGLSIAAALMLIVQVLVGAITVRLELPTSTVVLHLALASVLLATLIIAGLRTQQRSGPPGPARPDDTYRRWTMGAAALGFVTLVVGGLVANTGAAPLCQGFPLCNGQLIPEGGGLVHLHWTHRLLGYVLLIVVAVSIERTVRQGAPAAVRRAAVASGLLVVAQIAVAAAMVLLRLPSDLRAAHLAVGAALWAAMVVWTTLAFRQTAPQPLGQPAGALV